jgi:hypothetical protein
VNAVRCVPDEDRAVAPAPRSDPLRRVMVVLLLLASLLLLSMGDGADPDLWGHVRYGQDVLATGRLPATATHTFTAVGQPWINHENAAELLFAAIANRAGGPGLMILKDLFGLVVMGLLVRTAYRSGVSLLVTALVVALVGWSISPGWSVRPQIFTYTFFALMVSLIDGSVDTRAGERRIAPTIWLLPVLLAVWANSHGGFLAGLGIGGLYLGGRGLEMLHRHGRRAFGDVGRLTLVLAATGLAPLVNPYGPRLISWLVEDLAVPRPEIGEWHALAPSTPPAVAFIILLALTAATFLVVRPRDLPRLLVLALAGWQAIAHARHAPFFAILAGFWLPPRLEHLRERLARRSEPRPDPRPAPPANAVRRVRMIAWSLSIAMVAGMAFHSRALWVRKKVYPVAALEFMARHHLRGKLVVHFDWAQYALAAFAPETTVGFDGRFRTCYPQEIADMHFDFLIGDLPGNRWRDPASPPEDDARILEYGRPDLVLLRRNSSHAVAIVEAHPEWVLLYQDEIARLWGRHERWDDPASPDYLPPAERRIADDPQSGWVAWPAFPRDAPGARTPAAS